MPGEIVAMVEAYRSGAGIGELARGSGFTRRPRSVPWSVRVSANGRAVSATRRFARRSIYGRGEPMEAVGCHLGSRIQRSGTRCAVPGCSFGIAMGERDRPPGCEDPIANLPVPAIRDTPRVVRDGADWDVCRALGRVGFCRGQTPER